MDDPSVRKYGGREGPSHPSVPRALSFFYPSILLSFHACKLPSFHFSVLCMNATVAPPALSRVFVPMISLSGIFLKDPNRVSLLRPPDKSVSSCSVGELDQALAFEGELLA